MNMHEEKILFLLSVFGPKAEALESVLKNLPFVDWQLILDKSKALGSASLVYANLKQAGLWDKIDIPNKQAFANIARTTMAMNFANFNAFTDITKKLNAIGIKPMPLKGLSLNIDTYNKLHIRPCCDIDILLDKKDILKSADILKASGYNIVGNYSQEIVFRNKQFMHIDLHYRLIPWEEEKHIYKICSEDILKRSKEMDLGGCKILTMDKNDEILYLAVVCARGGYKEFKYYADIDAIIRTHNSAVKWEYLYKKAAGMQFRKKLDKIFLFSSLKLGTPIPPCEYAKKTKKTFNAEFFFTKRKWGHNVFAFLQSPTLKDKAFLLVIYLKWKGFVRYGFFKDYFNEKICILDKRIFTQCNKKN